MRGNGQQGDGGRERGKRRGPRHAGEPGDVQARGDRLYFAYGSNLDVNQMATRCPGARLVGPARLDGHRLAFAGASRLWGGGVATVIAAPGHHVPGVVYAVGSAELGALDAFEGHPWFYERRRVRVRGDEGHCRAIIYALNADRFPLAAPADAYVETIVRGYSQHGIDPIALTAAIELARTAGGGA